jgi:putative transposase
MPPEQAVVSHERWAHLRFAVVGPLLASPPPLGQLQAELARLAGRVWQHPISGEPVRFAGSTIERWFYKARAGANPVSVLQRQRRRDSGEQHAIEPRLAELLQGQHQAHPSWSYQLHLDNLSVVLAEQPDLGPLPSYASLRRYMVAHGWRRQPRKAVTPSGVPISAGEPQHREVRSYETSHVGGLWHLDFHHGSRKVLSSQGEWFRPLLLAILDDHSRLICHAQWYRSETAESLVHGLV